VTFLQMLYHASNRQSNLPASSCHRLTLTLITLQYNANTDSGFLSSRVSRVATFLSSCLVMYSSTTNKSFRWGVESKPWQGQGEQVASCMKPGTPAPSRAFANEWPDPFPKVKLFKFNAKCQMPILHLDKSLTCAGQCGTWHVHVPCDKSSAKCQAL